MRHVAVSALLFVAACATPLERCISAATKDIRILDRLIAVGERNLERGYAVIHEEYISTNYRPCKDSAGNIRMCEFPTVLTRTVPVSIDLDRAQAVLNSQKTKRQQLVNQAANDVQACKAEYPET